MRDKRYSIYPLYISYYIMQGESLLFQSHFGKFVKAVRQCSTIPLH